MVSNGGTEEKPQYDMMELKVQDLSKTNVFYNIECEPDATVEDLKCLITIQSGIDLERQVLYFRQEVLNQDSKKLSECGIFTNDMINMGLSNLSTAD
jgi:hypothetical protein